MSPYEAVFGRILPTLHDYLAKTLTVVAVDDILAERTTLISALCENLKRAQVRICNQAYAGRTDVQFQ